MYLISRKLVNTWFDCFSKDALITNLRAGKNWQRFPPSAARIGSRVESSRALLSERMHADSNEITSGVQRGPRAHRPVMMQRVYAESTPVASEQKQPPLTAHRLIYTSVRGHCSQHACIHPCIRSYKLCVPGLF